MKRIIPLVSMTAAVVASATPAFAAPFNPKDIAADAVTLVHVDCDAIRAGAIGQWLLSEPEAQDNLASMGAPIDLDVRTQLHGITFYTTSAHPKDGVTLVSADFEPGHVLEKAQALNDFRAATNGSHVIYSWLDEKWKRREGGTAAVYGAISGHHLLFGQTEARLAEALDVLQGTDRGVDAGKELLPAKPGEQILFEAVILKVDFPNAKGPAAVLQMCKSVYLKLSEANSNTTAIIHLETADDDSATQVSTIVQGFQAMLKMRASDTNAARLANSITVTREGLEVGVTIAMPSSDLVDMMKSGQEQAEKRRAIRRAREKDREREKEKDSQPKDKQ